MAIPKHYKLAKEHSDSYEIHDSRDKKHFHVAKKDLNLGMHDKLAKMPKLADGGEVDQETTVRPDKGWGKVIMIGQSEGGWAGVENSIAGFGSKIQHAFDPKGGTQHPISDQTLLKTETATAQPTPKPTNTPTTTVSGSEQEYWKGGPVKKMAFGTTPEDASSIAQAMGVNQPPPAAAPQAEPRFAPLNLPPPDPNLTVENERVVEKPKNVDVGQIAGAPQGQPQGTPSVGAMPNAPYDIGKELETARQQAETGILGATGAEATKAQEMQKMYQAQQNDLATMKTEHDTRLKTLNDRSTALFNNIQAGKIDPDQYWQNHSRISAGLGVLISGIGAGLQKSTTNMAMNAIQDGIEKNIDAQKANLNTKNNLYRMNMEQTHNEAEAYAMTKADLITMTAAKANEISAGVGTAQAEANKNTLLSQLGVQQAQLHQQLASAGIARQAYTNGIPAAAVPYLHPDQQKRMVPLSNGNMADAGSDDSAKTVKEAIQPIMDVRSSLDRLDQISPVLAKMPYGPARAKAEAEVNNITNNLMMQSKQNRFADPAVNFQMEKFSDPTKLKEIFNGTAGTDQLRKILDGKMDSVYRANVPAYTLQQGKQSQIPFKKND